MAASVVVTVMGIVALVGCAPHTRILGQFIPTTKRAMEVMIVGSMAALMLGLVAARVIRRDILERERAEEACAKVRWHFGHSRSWCRSWSGCALPIGQISTSTNDGWITPV